MASRSRLPTSDQTSLVDTFTCAIAILFVLIISLAGTSTQPRSLSLPDLVATCELSDSGGTPIFRFAADGLSGDSDEAQARAALEKLSHAEALSMRLSVRHAADDYVCREAAQKLVDAHNEEAAIPLASAALERPYLILDLVPDFGLTGAERGETR
jgi:hypothetical protein